MITIKDFMEAVNYRLTEGSEYGWDCYSRTAYSLTSWSGDTSDIGYSAEVIFDTGNQLVYEMSVCDYAQRRAYRWIHPDYRQSYYTTSTKYTNDPDVAWDNVNYVDIEVHEDILEKARAICAGKEYDTRVTVPVDLPDDVMFQLMKQAHEEDITLNSYISKVLREEMQRGVCA